MKTPAALAAVLALSLGAAACGSDDEGSTGTGSGSGASTPTQTQQPTPEPVAEIPSLTGESTSVRLDTGFLEALEMLEVTPGVSGDATLEGRRVSFPITGGDVTYFDPASGVTPFVQGEIMHRGSGLTLSAGGTTVRLDDFVVDPGASVLTGRVSANGEVAARNAPLFFLDGGTLEPLRMNDEGNAILQGTTVELKAEAAELLNQTFEIDALEEGLEIGIATIEVVVPS